MKFFKFIFCFLVLFCVQAEATYIPYACTLTVAGRCFSKAEMDRFESGTTGVILYGATPDDGRITTFRRANGTAGYQVPSGKTLTMKAALITNGIGRAVLGYGDTDVGANSGSAPTTPVYIGGWTSSVAPFFGNSASSWNSPNGYSLDFQVPATKYPFFFGTGSTYTSVILYAFID